MENEININQWIEKFNNGEYNNPDCSTQCSAGWYDWFCNDSSLAGKTKSLGKKLIAISKSPKFNCNTSYVFFKNNCPCNGNLYDDFRICSIDDGDVLYTITPKCGHKVSEGKGNIWGRENNFEQPLFQGSWTEIKNWFLK